MKIFKLLGLTAILTTALSANANVGKYISVNPLKSPVEVPIDSLVSEFDSSDIDEANKIDTAELLQKIRENPNIELTEKERTAFEKIQIQSEHLKEKEKRNANIILFISLGTIILAGVGITIGTRLDNKNRKKYEIK